ncbi:MAG: hypothetical protein QOK18_1784 [Mycobacterium sp.]|jgi:hypothetical protein|nr:hypothetical protein [Mycobacterium sp.]
MAGLSPPLAERVLSLRSGGDPRQTRSGIGVIHSRHRALAGGSHPQRLTQPRERLGPSLVRRQMSEAVNSPTAAPGSASPGPATRWVGRGYAGRVIAANSAPRDRQPSDVLLLAEVPAVIDGLPARCPPAIEVNTTGDAKFSTTSAARCTSRSTHGGALAGAGISAPPGTPTLDCTRRKVAVSGLYVAIPSPRGNALPTRREPSDDPIRRRGG